MKRYPVAYVRKSKRNDDSAAAQLAAVRAIAERDGTNPDALVVLDDNGRSGDVRKLARRRGYLQLVEAIERGEVATLYVRVLDRLGRDTGEGLRLYELMEEKGTRLVDQIGEASGESGEDRVMMELWAAKKELRRAKDRSAFTRAQREKRGDVRLGGHIARYGRKWVRAGSVGMAGDPQRIVEVENPDEPLEPLAVALRETRGNVLQATKLLNARGSTCRGRPWNARTLGRIADREGLQRGRLGTHRRRAPSDAPLSRLVRCVCGTTMTAVRDRRTGRWSELYCARGHREGVSAHGRYVARARHVIDLLRAEIPRRRIVPLHKRGRDTAAEQRKLEEELRRLGRAYRAGAVEDAEFDAESARLKQALDDLAADEATVEWTGFGKPRPEIDWDDPVALGEALRARVRWVVLDENMMPIRVEWRGKAPGEAER